MRFHGRCIVTKKVDEMRDFYAKGFKQVLDKKAISLNLLSEGLV